MSPHYPDSKNVASFGDLRRHYDAIAKAATIIHSESGARIIVFLTDGDDNSSKFKIKDIESMNLKN